MNYRHSYHAGSFTDVFKHTVLVSLIQALQRKETPICYLDTHAGTGHYDLFSEEAQKSKEFEGGIGQLFEIKNPPTLVKQYLACIQAVNTRLAHSEMSRLRYYAGSPAIMRYFLREQDRMVLTELHPQDYQLLKNYFSDNKRVNVHLLDGYQGLKAFLPPKERRGLILIDPPYEKSNELEHLVSALSFVLKRFATGVYAVWYPIKNRLMIDQFHRALKNVVQCPTLITELSIYPEDSAQHLNGCGMAIINPPWQLDIQILEYLPWLWNILSVHGQGKYRASPL
ncbi:MAG: rlmJ [Gammaproteobacteria bacterium]|jgi:23S rRNA (adenine2030-N6)-methyltransferase|nr:rlmJ [Gammaproteobacteria bacterium]